MKRYFVYSFILVFAFVTSCQKADFQQQFVSSEPNENSVSLSEALGIASNFAMSDKAFMATRASDPSIKEAFTLNDTDGLPLFHAVNYEGGGFVVIAGDNRLQPVQAYSPKGGFSANKKDYPWGLKVWMESVQGSLRKIKNNDLEQDLATHAAWRKYTENPRGFLNTRSLEPEGGVLPEADTLVGPFLDDSWHQASPYNDSLAVQPHYSYPGGVFVGYTTPVVGCVPLAMARIMRYHGYPSSFSWSLMPDSTPQSAATMSFIKDIHAKVVEYGYSFYYRMFTTSYGGYQKGTGLATSFPIGSFLQSKYGYATGVDESYSLGTNYNSIRREMIDHQLPFIIRGQDAPGNSNTLGHAWICDGYHYICNRVYDNNNEPIGAYVNIFLHYCWGMTSTNPDGWFINSEAELNDVEYKYNMTYTHRISPVDYWN